MRWFDRTHTFVVGFGAAAWQLTHLPRAGGVGEQDARLMSALDHLRDVHNTVTMESLKRARAHAKTQTTKHVRR